MRRSIVEYTKTCDTCQGKKEMNAKTGNTNQSLKQANKHRRANLRSFTSGDCVYLHNPARKPGLSSKFHKCWSGPYKITNKVSNLNYEILGTNGRRQVVHVNRLKPARGYSAVESKARPPRKGRIHRHSTSDGNNDEQADVKLATGPLTAEDLFPPTAQPLTAHGSSRLDPVDSPLSEQRDPTYVPGDSPRSRREMRETRREPPLTRSRTKSVRQEQVGPEIAEQSETGDE